MQHNIYVYIAIMVIVTTIIRVLPLTLIRREIKNVTLRSFLYYIPYVTLAVAAWLGKSLFFVSSAACIVVFILEFFV